MKTKFFSIATIGIGITLVTVLVGELFRFKGVLLLDLWAPLFAGAWLIWKLRQRTFKPLSALMGAASVFVGVGLASLLLNSAEMSWGGVIGAGLYGVRWASLILLGLLLMSESKETKRWVLVEVVIFSVLLSVAGFVQLMLVPDFTDYEILGWDPHQGRLLSTWFDPNFVGGWLAVIAPVILGLAWDERRWRWIWLVGLGIVSIALLLTLSRSAYLALIAGMGIFSLIRSRTLLAGLLLAAILATAALPPVRDRMVALVDSTQSVLTETYSLPDASARHRFGSWEEGWRLFLEQPLLGHGYNRYAEAALELGTLKDTEIHSANGSDSSLITVLATTGVIGFVSFMVVYGLALRGLWAERRRSEALGLFAGLSGLFIHSIFVNSLLFPLLMAPLWILIGATLRQSSAMMRT